MATHPDSHDADDRDDFDPEARLRRKKSGNGPLIAMLSIGLLLIGGLIFALYYFLGSSSKLDAEMLAYLPAETNLMVGVDVEDLVKNDKVKGLVAKFFKSMGGKEAAGKLKEAGISENDVSRILFGGKPSFDENGGEIVDDKKMKKPNDPLTAVVRFKNAVDKAKIVKAIELAEKTKNGKTYYTSDEQKSLFVYFPSTTLMVVTSTETEIDSLTKRDPAKVGIAQEMQDLAKKMNKGQVWAAISRSAIPDERMKQIDLVNAIRVPYLPPELVNAVKDMKGAGFWLKIDGDKVDFAAGVLCLNAEAASKAESALQKEIADQRNKNLENNALVGAPLKEASSAVKNFASNLQKSISANRSGDLVEISAHFNISEAEALFNDLRKAELFQPDAGQLHIEVDTPEKDVANDIKTVELSPAIKKSKNTLKSGDYSLEVEFVSKDPKAPKLEMSTEVKDVPKVDLPIPPRVVPK